MTFRLVPLEQPRDLVRLHVEDAGHLPDGRPGVELACAECGYETGWVPERGRIKWFGGRDSGNGYQVMPCPHCNDARDIAHNAKIERLLS